MPATRYQVQTAPEILRNDTLFSSQLYSLLTAGGLAIAQVDTSPSSRPITGATSGTRPPDPPRIISSSQNLDVLRHRDPTGKPCLNVWGFARPQIVNPNSFDHVIMANNNCSQLIKIQVCYYHTQQCAAMEVQGRMRKEAVLGTTSLKDFRYEFRERF
jgi:hypothetical protein